QRLLDVLDTHPAAAVARAGGQHGGLERIQRDARVAADGGRERRQRVVIDLHAERAEAALRVLQRVAQDALDVLRLELLQREDARAREQRADHFERWVLGRRADERNRAVLDERQDRVLLRLVESVDLVDEQDG